MQNNPRPLDETRAEITAIDQQIQQLFLRRMAFPALSMRRVPKSLPSISRFSSSSCAAWLVLSRSQPTSSKPVMPS